MNHQIPFVPITCNARALTLFNDLSDAGLMFFCLLCASQNEYRGLKPGDFFFSKAALAKRLHISRDTLTIRLNRLSHAGYITVSTSNYGTKITVNDWQAWHSSRTPDNAEFVCTPALDSVNPYMNCLSMAWVQIRQEGKNKVATTNNTKRKNKEEQINTDDNSSVSSSLAFSEDFERLWFAYPAQRRTRKDEAAMLFEKAIRNGATIDAMLKALEQDKRSEIWADGTGVYVPGIIKWLERESWHDHLEVKENAKWETY